MDRPFYRLPWFPKKNAHTLVTSSKTRNRFQCQQSNSVLKSWVITWFLETCGETCQFTLESLDQPETKFMFCHTKLSWKLAGLWRYMTYMIACKKIHEVTKAINIHFVTPRNNVAVVKADRHQHTRYVILLITTVLSTSFQEKSPVSRPFTVFLVVTNLHSWPLIIQKISP